jgi:hypothetical protein
VASVEEGLEAALSHRHAGPPAGAARHICQLDDRTEVRRLARSAPASIEPSAGLTYIDQAYTGARDTGAARARSIKPKVVKLSEAKRIPVLLNRH